MNNYLRDLLRNLTCLLQQPGIPQTLSQRVQKPYGHNRNERSTGANKAVLALI